MPLKTVEDVDIAAYPVTVLNISEAPIAVAASPTEYVTLWNSDTANQAKGVLRTGPGSFCFFLNKVTSVIPPSKVLGETIASPGGGSGFGFIYGYTELDTTGATPTESEYVNSVDPALAVPTIFVGATLAAGSNVQVDDFLNPSDKVLIIQVNSTVELPFTKWSEFGNPLQQNQPIDPNYATGSNVFFKSTRGGYPIYITRSQTTFTGAVILSR